MTSESKPTTMGCRAIHDMMISRSTRRISQLPAEALTHESCYYDVLSAVNSVPGLHMCFEAWSKTVGPRTSQTGSRLESLKQLSQIQRQRYAMIYVPLGSNWAVFEKLARTDENESHSLHRSPRISDGSSSGSIVCLLGLQFTPEPVISVVGRHATRYSSSALLHDKQLETSRDSLVDKGSSLVEV
ncbi:hypothetical protein SCLCIDRAFT_571000 [Scleroderma citrinum Foug A]|uniref:Uncharacterized protein n=1 Tax=Scleroderma citrinum Foug A TaxID=1036808 RepID=A0A0C3D7B9_9AGAM|nr:hypothetical protein SCLCIDRAFT_571000 [Scleroderma citrinum Foug A]